MGCVIQKRARVTLATPVFLNYVLSKSFEIFPKWHIGKPIRFSCSIHKKLQIKSFRVCMQGEEKFSLMSSVSYN